MTIEDAKTLLGFASMIIIPFAVTWLKAVTWPDYIKFMLAALLSLVVGYLTAYTAGQIFLDGSIVQNGAVVFTATQIVYYAAFRGLGLEKVLFPQSALAHHAQDQAVKEVANVSVAEARDVLDPNTKPTLDVQANVVLDGSTGTKIE